jgi:hypothetical protein
MTPRAAAERNAMPATPIPIPPSPRAGHHISSRFAEHRASAGRRATGRPAAALDSMRQREIRDDEG